MHTVTTESIQEWLIAQLAEHLGLPSEGIDTHRPITTYGLDSITGISLAGDLEAWLQLQLSPTLLWDYPTIASLAQHLTHEVQRGRTGNVDDSHICQLSRARLDQQRPEQLLARVDRLSDAEVATILNTLLAA